MIDRLLLITNGKLLDDTFVLLTMVIGLFGLLGALSQSMIVAGFVLLSAFAIVTVETGFRFFELTLYILVTIITIGLSGQVWEVTIGDRT